MPRRYRSLPELAERIHRRAWSGRVVHLSPATAIVVAAAVRAFATRPGRDDVALVFCGVRKRDRGRCEKACITCIAKANEVQRLYCPDAVDHPLDGT